MDDSQKHSIEEKEASYERTELGHLRIPTCIKKKEENQGVYDLGLYTSVTKQNKKWKNGLVGGGGDMICYEGQDNDYPWTAADAIVEHVGSLWSTS